MQSNFVVFELSTSKDGISVYECYCLFGYLIFSTFLVEYSPISIVERCPFFYLNLINIIYSCVKRSLNLAFFVTSIYCSCMYDVCHFSYLLMGVSKKMLFVNG